MALAVMMRLRTVVSVGGVEEGTARTSLPRMLERLRGEPRVAAAGAAWMGGRLVVTVEAEVDGPVRDGDEAENFHRVWRCAVACLGGESGRLEFEIEGSI